MEYDLGFSVKTFSVGKQIVKEFQLLISILLKA